MITTVKKITQINYGKGLPQNKRVYGSVPVYGSSGITGRHNQALVKGPGIIIGRKGNIGKVFYTQDDFFPIDTVYYITPEDTSYNLKYLYYLFQQLDIKQTSDSVIPGLNRDYIYSLGVENVSLPEQKRIASILSSFDNKIELLRKENNTLENIAQSIFKEWFVKYNFPSKEGKPYKDNNGKMIDSELGEIPEGWRVGKLGELVEIKNGFAFKSEDYEASGYPIIRTMNFEDTGYINNQSLVFLSEQKAKEYHDFNFNEFDLCVVMVGASLGKTALVTKNNLPALQNQNMWSFKPKKEVNRFYNNLVLQDLVKQNLRSASGSAREFFRKDHFYSVDVIIPSDAMISCFGHKIQPIYQNLSNNLQMVNTLSDAKKYLLVKLIKS